MEGLSALNRGVRALTKAVTTTLGPQGSQVVIKKDHSHPYVTKHGASIAKALMLSDAFENIGLKIAREASTQTESQVGDGSTTAIVLTDALFSAGLKGIACGLDPLEIKQGIILAGDMLTEELAKLAVSVKSPDDVLNIATTSANNDPIIGKIISDAIAMVGVEGVFSIKESLGTETTLQTDANFGFNSGYLSSYFVTDPETMEVRYENAYLLLCNQTLSSLNQSFIRFLEQISQEGKHPLIIIAEDFDPQLLSILIVNKLKGNLPICAVKASGDGEYRKQILEDIAILTGGTLIGDMSGVSLDEAGFDVLGHVGKIIITETSMIFSEGKGDSAKIEERINSLRCIIQSSSELAAEDIEKRLAGLVGGTARISLGAATEAEFKEKRSRLESALQATKAACKEGCLPGGGVALVRAASVVKIPDTLSTGEVFGCKCLLQSAEVPLKAIAVNCGKASDNVLDTILKHPDPYFGYNGITDSFENLISSGVCDALTVTKFALKYSISIACLLLTSSFFIVDSSVEVEDSQFPGT